MLTADFTPNDENLGPWAKYRVLGDYEAMTVRGGTGAPACGAAGTFFPVWTFLDNPSDNAGNPTLQTTEVTP